MRYFRWRGLGWAGVLILLLVCAMPLRAASPSNISLSTENDTLSLNDFKGKVVYVDFWASWCGPCRKSFPWLNQVQSRYGEQGLQIVAINVDKDRQLAKKFLAEYPANFVVAFDPEGAAASSFGVQAMPSSFLIDRNGEIAFTHRGFKEKHTHALEGKIETLLNQ